jgi:putative PIN family toxin of toxin-antitoxin system
VLKRHKYTSDQLDTLVEEIRAVATKVIPGETLNVVAGDRDDNKFIECAVAGEADYIVSGDAHLLSLGQYRSIKLLSPAAFLILLNQK